MISACTDFPWRITVDLRNKNDELSTGVRILDCDHREQSETITELRTTLSKGEDRSRTASLLRKLSRFTHSHFALEEGMMAATKYPGAALHRIHHQRLMARMDALVSRCNRGSLPLYDQAIRVLTGFHHAHIEGDDLSYGYWLNGVRVH
jgi:hemerythrin